MRASTGKNSIFEFLNVKAEILPLLVIVDLPYGTLVKNHDVEYLPGKHL
jgi:hypothetical protein